MAAVKKNKLVGFLCCAGYFENAFRSTNVKGVFSPIEANGTIEDNKNKIYAKMYQYAAKKWVEAGAASHAICLYSQDKISQHQFFKYGFGLRCIDAIRLMEKIDCQICYDYKFLEFNEADFKSVFPMDIMLNKHMKMSPTFINRQEETIENFAITSVKEKVRYFVAKSNENICAFLKIAPAGENFLTKIPGMKNIKGAFCLPEHRGKGLYQNLLNYSISILKSEGYTYLGVDFESINPTAYSFWLKYFTPYTNSVVRRIDEKILNISF
ncbi:MAG: GNAT family N-acetyltransferase [Clostridiales bacterium]